MRAELTSSLTNDGHAILREIDVAHPAAKSMIELSRTQDEEVGDGTTSVIILGASYVYLIVPRNANQQLERSWLIPFPSLNETSTLSSLSEHSKLLSTMLWRQSLESRNLSIYLPKPRCSL
jgi:chaperonin GroEL (HSP60 family)